MSINAPRRHVGDTLRPLSVLLTQEDEVGVSAAVNLTGKTVKFKMVNAGDGTTAVALTTTGITITSATLGKVEYDFATDNTIGAGVYWGYFVVTDTGETDHFPVGPNRYKILMDSDSQTAEEAYEVLTAE